MVTEGQLVVLDSSGQIITEGDTVRFRALCQLAAHVYEECFLVGPIEHIFYKNGTPFLIVKAGMFTHVVKACKAFKER